MTVTHSKSLYDPAQKTETQERLARIAKEAEKVRSKAWRRQVAEQVAARKAAERRRKP